MKNTRKVLVCGAGGFIDFHLVKRLKSEGCWGAGWGNPLGNLGR